MTGELSYLVSLVHTQGNVIFARWNIMYFQGPDSTIQNYVRK